MLLNPKVASGTLSASLAILAVWVASYFVTVPPEAAAALSTALGFVGGYVAPWIPKPPTPEA